MSEFESKRRQMVKLLSNKGITDQLVLKSMAKVQRHLFVPDSMQVYAYEDSALPIGYKQTISQPYIVAFMTKQAQLNPRSKVLEIGTGSGYQTAVLTEICQEVYTVEIIESLAKKAEALFKKLGYLNIHTKIADGHLGWQKKAPFDAIITTAAAQALPEELVTQLKVGGCLIIPLEDESTNMQTLVKIVKSSEDNHYLSTRLLPVRFVPMVERN